VWRKSYLMVLLVLGLIIVPGLIQLFLTGEAGILGVSFPLIPATILVWIFLLKSQDLKLSVKEIGAGVVEGIVSVFVLAIGLLGIWESMEWRESWDYILLEWGVNWFPWALAGGFGLGCVFKRKNRALVAIALAFLFSYVMSFAWWASLFTGYPGVSGPPVNYGEFFATFFGMLVINIAACSFERERETKTLLQKRIFLSLGLLGFLALGNIFSAPFSGKVEFLAAGAVVGVITVTVPFVFGLLITLGVLVLPLGTRFGYAPWSGAPIDTLTPRVWILSGLAIVIWILRFPLYRLLKRFLDTSWRKRVEELVIKKRAWIVSFVCLAMVAWFLGGGHFGLSAMATLCEQMANIVVIMILLYLLIFVLTSILPKEKSAEML